MLHVVRHADWDAVLELHAGLGEEFDELEPLPLADAELDAQPFYLSVYFDERLLGVVPLVVEPVETWCGPVRLLRFVEAGGPAAFVVGPHPGTVLTAALIDLANHRDDWDVLQLDVHERAVRARTSLRLSKLSFASRVFRAKSLAALSTTRFIAWSRPVWRTWALRIAKPLRRRLNREPVRCEPECLEARPPLELVR